MLCARHIIDFEAVISFPALRLSQFFSFSLSQRRGKGSYWPSKPGEVKFIGKSRKVAYGKLLAEQKEKNLRNSSTDDLFFEIDNIVL